MNSGERIRKLRKTKNLTQAELATRANVARTTVVSWEKNLYLPEGDNLKRLARELDTTQAYLLGETDDPDNSLRAAIKVSTRTVASLATTSQERGDDESSHKLTSADLVPNCKEPGDVIMIPHVSASTGCGSCGSGSAYPEVGVEFDKFVPVPSRRLAGYSWQGAEFRCMDAEGDSMEPYIHEGDEVLFAMGANVSVGDVAVVMIDGCRYIKGIVKMTNEELILRSYNWQSWPDKRVKFEEYPDGSVYIEGKVIDVISYTKPPRM